jgi:hypothetical protein
LNDEVTVISLKTFTVADHYTKSDADTLLAAKSPLASPSFTGSVGIGTSSPLGNLSVEGNGRLVTIGDSGSTNVPEIKATNAAGTGEAFLKISAYEHRIGTNSTQRLTVQNNGHVKINTGNLIIGTSGQGIDFSANADSSATGASTTSELLDSYEEGTFTPTVIPSTGGAVTYNSAVKGTYTKVGRLVHIQIEADFNKNTSTGHYSIQGIPFAFTSNPPRGVGFDWYTPSGSAFVNSMIYTSSGASTLHLYAITSANADATASSLTHANLSTRAVIRINLSYPTS